ncbi:DegT/DnrJ/EryC1/StrS family aminotransferase [Novosphingobium profundi]|nr:DegT/DnrJ/EryC1/StrS family aminotransferase [Novosphingobium profundi]MBT0667225.1 DegT/DnrJ/EryC1/StrS family aminotransferase [Novosphingobium profundi]
MSSTALAAARETRLPIEALRSRWPCHEEDEIAAACAVLRTGRVNALVHGEHTREFAREFAAYVGMPSGVCVANGTVSLEIALKALGIGPGDEVIVPARSFFATASAVMASGASLAFADVEPVSQNIDPASVERLIGPRTRAVICVHLAGWPCDMDRLVGLCEAHGLSLIEDCAQAHGAQWRGRRVGAFGAAASFSFCTDKIMSTGGEGGLILLRDPAVWETAWSIKDHGKDHALLHDGQGRPGEFRYVHERPGSNHRMTEMQAALGRCQLAKLEGWLARRRENAEALHRALAGIPGLTLPAPPPHVRHAWYKFYVQLDEDQARRRMAIIAALHERGIPAGSGACPDMSREHALARWPWRSDAGLATAQALGQRTLMFPCDQTLAASDMARMADALAQVLAR